MRFALPLALLCSVAFWGLPSEAGAQAGSTAQVDDWVERGIALRRAGDDVRALEAFRRAEKLEPDSARVRVHLAATYQALGRWEEADRYLALALEDPTHPYVQKHQEILAAARRTIDRHMATLEIFGGPRGARVHLNGQPIGTLPLEQPLRVRAGIYTLEAQLPGHYPITRSVALAGGALVREQLSLTPISGEMSGGAAGTGTRDDAGAATGGARWLPWAFAGLAAGAGAGSAIAWAAREGHVDRWNDDGACLSEERPQLTREELCRGEREAGERAETWMWIGAASAGAFAAASVVSFWLLDVGAAEEEGAITVARCGVGFAAVQCVGRF